MFCGLFRAMRHQRIVEAFRSCLIEAVKEVAIPVKGDLDRGVPEAGPPDPEFRGREEGL